MYPYQYFTEKFTKYVSLPVRPSIAQMNNIEY